MQEKIILTDCDGVLLNWERMFHLWMDVRGYTRQDSTNYDISYAYGIEKSLGHDLVREFNASAWIRYLPGYLDARSGVAKLQEAGYKFVCITSLSLDKYARLLRIDNLNDVFGRDTIADVICLDTGADKDGELAKWKNTGYYWIEDKAENAVTGAELGLNSLLLTHKHNNDFEHEQVKRVANWAEITQVILDN